MYIFAALTAGQMIYKVIQKFSPQAATAYAIVGTILGVLICLWAWRKSSQAATAIATTTEPERVPAEGAVGD
jgi:hypothetical protein